jgi:carbon-monoxide dehydrogenase medium subunit
MLPEFEMWTPKTMSEALGQLAGGEAAPVGGGTNVVVDLRSRRHVPRALVDVSRLSEMRGIRREDGWLVAGGGATVAELLASPLVQENGGSLAAAARLFANPLVRNRATLAGNLADASPAADMAPPLLALDAEVELISLSDCRRVPLAEFFTGVRKTVRRAEELLAAVRWPVPGASAKFCYAKLGLRQADAISVISVAVQVEADSDGRCHLARIAMGAVAPTPLRARAAEASLVGKPLDAEAISAAAHLAAEATHPITDLRATAGYRKRVAEVLVRRLLTQAAGLLEEPAEA